MSHIFGDTTQSYSETQSVGLMISRSSTNCGTLLCWTNIHRIGCPWTVFKWKYTALVPTLFDPYQWSIVCNDQSIYSFADYITLHSSFRSNKSSLSELDTNRQSSLEVRISFTDWRHYLQLTFRYLYRLSQLYWDKCFLENY